MIKILEKYLIKTITLSTAMTTLVIAGVLFLMSLLNELKNIGEGDYGLSQALLFVLMHMPSELYQFAPMLILLGSIAGLSILSSYRELAVMRASGFANRQIIYSALGAVFILIFSLGLIGEGIAPKMNHIAEINKENNRNAGQAVVTGTGVWLHVDNNFIHIKQVVGQHLLEGVTRYQFDDKHHLQAAYYAKSLAYEDHEWITHNEVKTTFFKERTKSQTLEQEKWDLKFNSNLLNIGLADPSQMSLPKLAKFAKYLEQNGLRASEYRYEFWQRIFQPIAALVMVFLAIPFVLGTLSSTLGFRMVIGILVGFAFFISNSFLGQVCIVYQIPAAFAALLPIVVFAILGIFLSRRLIRL